MREEGRARATFQRQVHRTCVFIFHSSSASHTKIKIKIKKKILNNNKLCLPSTTKWRANAFDCDQYRYGLFCLFFFELQFVLFCFFFCSFFIFVLHLHEKKKKKKMGDQLKICIDGSIGGLFIHSFSGVAGGRSWGCGGSCGRNWWNVEVVLYFFFLFFKSRSYSFSFHLFKRWLESNIFVWGWFR